MSKKLIKIYTNKSILYYFWIFLLFVALLNSPQSKTFAFENKILFKINNEIITTIDIKNEIQYLIALNKNLEELDNSEVVEIAKNSLIRQKIKEIELAKFTKIEIFEEKILDKIISKKFENLGFKSFDNFNQYMQKFLVNENELKKKITIDAIWSQYIISKFSSKINFNKKDLERQILEQKIFSNSYLLSEIVYNVEDESNLEDKYNLIKKTIETYGFENAALTHSISNTTYQGGKLGWVQESVLNKNINEILSKLKIGEYSKPIRVPSGFLIIKLEDIKKQERERNITDEVEKIYQSKVNELLNTYANIYFNKIAKDIKINEI